MWYAWSRKMTYSYLSKNISKHAQLSFLNNTHEIKISKYYIRPPPLFKEGNVLVSVSVYGYKQARVWKIVREKKRNREIEIIRK